MKPKTPFKLLGSIQNSLRQNPKDKGEWVIIQDTESGEIYEVLDTDLKPFNEI